MIGSLILGFLGSLHCVGMCGPLTITLLRPEHGAAKFGYYHLGRLATYSVIGMILGLIGYSFEIMKLQQWVSLFLGLSLLVIFLIPGYRQKIEHSYISSPLFLRIKNVLQRNLGSKSRWTFSGVMNGLLPCGMVLMASALAISAGSVWKSALYMIFFGLGTLPALALVSLGSNRLKSIFPKTQRLIPILASISGVILIIRGVLINQNDFDGLIREKVITICGF